MAVVSYIAASTITCSKPEDVLGQQLAATGRVILSGILFDSGKDTLKSESIPTLTALATTLQAAPGSHYVIEGYTDDRPATGGNQSLSERRAAAVKAWLVNAGGAADQLESQGFGEARPVATNDTPGGRILNRRVEVAIVQ